jgi:hypothetical protein
MCEKFLHPKIWQANMKKLLIALIFLPGCVHELRINWHEQDMWSDRLTRKEQQQTERAIAELSAVTWAVAHGSPSGSSRTAVAYMGSMKSGPTFRSAKSPFLAMPNI